MNTRIFNILLWNRDRVEAALIALNKRAVRKGLPQLTWSWGKAYRQTTKRALPDGSEECEHIDRIDLTLPVEVPRYEGWRFVAALEHLEEANIVRGVPGQDVPERFRTASPYCDHCKTARRRHDTYVLSHEDGRVLQVGSSCLQDFLGTDTAGKLAAMAQMLSSAGEIGEEGEHVGGGWVGGPYALDEFLPYVAWSVRELGWMSRKAADERGCGATADAAWGFLTDGKSRKAAGAEPTEADIEMGKKAAEWADALSDEQVNAERGDYLHNLRTVARTGYVTSRTAGIAASAVVAYQRFLGDEIKRQQRAARPDLNEYLGEVGKPFEAENVQLDFVAGYDSDYGYVTILKFRTAEGATLVWKTSSAPNLSRADVGKFFDISGKVKKHEEYKGRKQTCLTRCDVTDEVERAARAERLAALATEKAAKKEAAKAARKAERAAKKAALMHVDVHEAD